MVVYTVVRLAIFAGALAVMLALRVDPFIAALVAAVIGLCVSYLLLPRQRAAVVQTVVDIRNRSGNDDDNDIENAAIDRDTATPPPAPSAEDIRRDSV